VSHRVWLLAAILLGGLVATSGDASTSSDDLPSVSVAFDQAADDGVGDLQPNLDDDDDSKDVILTASHEVGDLEALSHVFPTALPPCSGPPGEPLFRPPRAHA
jgi:hypothetical protein